MTGLKVHSALCNISASAARDACSARASAYANRSMRSRYDSLQPLSLHQALLRALVPPTLQQGRQQGSGWCWQVSKHSRGGVQALGAGLRCRLEVQT